jgi:hypothetical protein
MTATMIDVAQIVDGYIAVWNETDGAARQALIAAGWTEDVSYTDPMADVSGREALDGLVAAVQAQFPGFVFRRLGEVEAHHEFLRFSWEAGPADSEAVVAGTDVATLAGGRLQRVVGFLDVTP